MTQSAPVRASTVSRYLVSFETRFDCGFGAVDIEKARYRFDQIEAELHASSEFADETVGFATRGTSEFVVIVSGIVEGDSEKGATRRAKEAVYAALNVAGDFGDPKITATSVRTELIER